MFGVVCGGAEYCTAPLPASHPLARLFPLCLLSASGVVSLSQALCSSDEYSNTLLHLDLSKNPGVLSGDDASVREHQPKTRQTLAALYLCAALPPKT